MEALKKHKNLEIIEQECKDKVIHFLWVKAKDIGYRIGHFQRLTKDKKYYRISRLNPYIGYTKTVKIPVNLIKIIKIFEGGHSGSTKKVSY